jgi:type II secretory pathway pseudopilin PulG
MRSQPEFVPTEPRRSKAAAGEGGITIIETTVILSVLFILAGVMSPIVSESVMTARAVKAKNDASMIAMGLINFQKDMGASALALTGASRSSAPDQATGFPAVLVSSGEIPSVEDAVEEDTLLPVLPLLVPPAGEGKRRGSGDPTTRAMRRKWQEGPTDALDDHLMRNRRGYRFRQPGEYGGWNGPYLSASIASDPWGNRYLINTKFLDGRTTIADEGGRVRRAVFVVSAGGNGVIETPFDQSVVDAQAFGDDIVIRIQ